MRTREQEDEQTVAIVSVLFGAALLWFAPLGLLAVVTGSYAIVNTAFPYVCVAYVVTVLLWLSSRSRRAS